MSEPAELSMTTRNQVRLWAQKLIDVVTNDDALSFDVVGGPMMSKPLLWSAMVMAQLERAQVIADSISKSALIAKLDRELFETNEHPERDAYELAYRKGWNAGRQGLKHDIERGEDITL
jgi:hypothetical protein